MSADLLAEFDSFYQSPPPPPQQDQSQSKQPATTSSDPFDFSHFGTSSTPAQPSQQTQQWNSLQTQIQPSGGSVWGDFSSLSAAAPTAQAPVEDDDGWGDFEVAESAPKEFPIPPTQPQASKPSPEPPQRTRILRASTIDLMTNNLIDVVGPLQTVSQPSWAKPATKMPPPKQPHSNPNMLFDADHLSEQEEEEEDDDDEFGDFETVPPPSQPAQFQPPKPQPASLDLLSLGDPPAAPPQRKLPHQLAALNLNAPTSPYPQAPRSPSFQERNPFPGLGLTTPPPTELKKDVKPKSDSPVTAWPSFEKSTTAAKETKDDDDDDDWAAFDDFPPESKAADLESTKPPEGWDWDAVDSVTPAAEETQVKDDAPPPINIPPPSVLLSIFPQLLDLANSSLFKTLGGQAAPVKKRILSDPGTITFLRGYLLLATVAARVIAGRKLRWHRDKFLAQGMAISAAGAKGMKLAGIDKTQANREDREAADVVGVWKEHVGRLRSTVAAANSAIATAGGQPLKVPELSENMPVQTAKVVPTAPKPCIICGLKRDERVNKVDYEVEDSFGEWWIEHWGHRACKNFWTEHEKQLRQR